MSHNFFRIKCLSVTDSTNLLAREAAKSGEPEGLVVQALQQTAGKGRLGRTWESPEGNLHVSFLLRPSCTRAQACTYSFAAAMAVYDALSDLRGDVDLQLKWPNDVLIDGKKISGILLEAAPAENDIVPWLVVGIGINVSHHPQNTLCPTTSLLKEGCTTTVDQVLDALLRGMHHWCQTLEKDGFGSVRRAWLADAKRGPLTVKTLTGEMQGQFGGLNDWGGLILMMDDGSTKVVQTGDVFFL